MSVPTIYRLKIDRFRGIKELSWRPGKGVNVILGGGDVGKTTILDAIGLLLSPTNATTISDTDYYARDIEAGFSVAAVFALPPSIGINDLVKQCWPWCWNGSEAVVASIEGDAGQQGEQVYCLRVRGAEHDLAYEIVQPDGSTLFLPVGLRRSIGLVRLSGDDRNDRDLRLVQGSALDRLLSDKSLRSRLSSGLAKKGVKGELTESARKLLEELDEDFSARNLPGGLDLAMTGGQGFAITALIGLTADRGGVQLPLSSWGAGTRRMAALAIAEQNQAEAPITLVDEIERGLEAYRQRSLMAKLQSSKGQVFVTTHSASVISAAADAAIWYLDGQGLIGSLEPAKIAQHRKSDPETFIARLTIVAEGSTEVGFVNVLLEKALASSLQDHGVHVTDGTGHDTALHLLEALAEGRLRFGGFVDNEAGKHPTRWQKVADKLGGLLFRWTSGCLEENVIGAVPDDKLEALLIDLADEKTGRRLRTLADRLGTGEEKNFETLKTKAGASLKATIVGAASGAVPEDKASEQKAYRAHAQDWFKSVDGGRELAGKMFTLGAWPTLKAYLMPFCNAVRGALNLEEVEDIAP